MAIRYKFLPYTANTPRSKSLRVRLKAWLQKLSREKERIFFNRGGVFAAASARPMLRLAQGWVFPTTLFARLCTTSSDFSFVDGVEEMRNIRISFQCGPLSAASRAAVALESSTFTSSIAACNMISSSTSANFQAMDHCMKLFFGEVFGLTSR